MASNILAHDAQLPTNISHYTRAMARHFKWYAYHICSKKYHEQHLQQLLVQVGLVKADVNGVPGGHHMVIVNHLCKRLRNCAMDE